MDVDAIKFNHDTSSAISGAMNIRKNASQSVSIPEWRNGISINQEDSSSILN